ncbi:MAG: hypothetical protein ACHQ01_00755 [Candidatus Limnocylindrales bacterium]
MPAGGTRSRTAAVGRRFKRRQIELTEGGTLVLHGDGSISQSDAAGETVGTWKPDDADWARHAIRFGLLPQPRTAVPPASRVNETRRL